MSKRLFAAILLAACALFALTCCGGSSDSTPAPATGLVTLSGASS